MRAANVVPSVNPTAVAGGIIKAESMVNATGDSNASVFSGSLHRPPSAPSFHRRPNGVNRQLGRCVRPDLLPRGVAHSGTELLKALRASNDPGSAARHKSAALRRGTGGKYQFAFWALRTKAASSALNRGASSKNGEWPMP